VKIRSGFPRRGFSGACLQFFLTFSEFQLLISTFCGQVGDFLQPQF
jgi:hypothetical protein